MSKRLASGDHNFNLWVPLELHERVKAVAKETDRTISGLIRHVLKKYIEEYDKEKP